MLNKMTTETTTSVAKTKAVIGIALPIVPTDVEVLIEPKALLRVEEDHHSDSIKAVNSLYGETPRQRVIHGALGSRIGATFQAVQREQADAAKE